MYFTVETLTKEYSVPLLRLFDFNVVSKMTLFFQYMCYIIY